VKKQEWQVIAKHLRQEANSHIGRTEQTPEWRIFNSLANVAERIEKETEK